MKENSRLASVTKRLRREFGENLALYHEIASNGKTSVLRGTLHGEEVVVKVLITNDDFYAESFLHEIDIYKAMQRKDPSFPLLTPIFTSREDGLIVLPKVIGRQLSSDRFPGIQELTKPRIKAVRELFVGIRRYDWEGALTREEVLSSYTARWERYLGLQIFNQCDREIIGILSSEQWEPEFNHGDPVPSNLIFDGDNVTILDWEYGGSFVPFYDEAILWAVLSRQPEQQSKLEADFLAGPRNEAICFGVNLLNVASREIRVHKEMPESDLKRNERLRLLEPLLMKARTFIDKVV